MALKRMTAREFRSGGSRSSGGGGGFLARWKSKTNLKDSENGKRATVDVFLATQQPIGALFCHPWPIVKDFKAKDSKTTMKGVFNEEWNCLETYETCEQQYFRDPTGEREAPPQVCPICRMIEYFHGRIDAGELPIPDDTPKGCERVAAMITPVFRFVGADAARATVLLAGALAGDIRYEFDDFSEDEVSYLHANGVYKKDAWKGVVMAKRQYVILAIDAKKPEDGIVVSTESAGLGSALEEMMQQQNEILGDPIETPYAIRWFYYPDEDPSSKYQCAPNPRLKPSAETVELIQTGKPPKAYEKAIGYGNVFTLRAQMEAACLLDDVPWDDIFGPAEALCDKSGFPKIAISEDVQLPEDEPVQVDGIDELPCDNDNCGKMIAATAEVCPHCGQKYEFDGPADAAPADDDAPDSDNIPF